MTTTITTQKRKRGRPYVGKLCAVRLPAEMQERIETSHRLGCQSKANVVRRVLAAGFAAEDALGQPVTADDFARVLARAYPDIYAADRQS